jgi:hypothetical protein
MKLPEVKNAPKYTGLYVVDFGDHCGVGFTGREVAELLESEKFGGCKVYRVYGAHPDGTMELRGVRSELFQLESGMLFHAYDEESARRDFKALVNLAVKSTPPTRAKVHLARLAEGRYATVLIYPAEADDEFSRWLSQGGYSTSAAAEGGTEVISRYYQQGGEVLEKHQLWSEGKWPSMTGSELLRAAAMAVVR